MLPINALTDSLPPEVVALGGLALAALAAYLGGRNAEARRKVIKFETLLRRFLRRELSVPSPEVEQVGRGHLDDALKANIPGYDGTNDPIHVVYADGTYLAPKPADVELIKMLATATSLLPYRPERFDCENFAGAFRTLAAFVAGVNSVGVVYDWTAGHAYNVIIDTEGTVYLFEPQEDREVMLGESEDYQLENGLIVF